jgi:Fe-S-cluster-containing hydrogenase component 2
MACATYHWGAVALHLSAIKWVEGEFLYGFRGRYPLFCKQCNHPECYYACPLKDVALCIDSVTGARYINRDECIGCGKCIEACPFEVTRINFDVEKDIVIKCDLCKGRAGGPVCVEICDRQALTLETREEK